MRSHQEILPGLELLTDRCQPGIDPYALHRRQHRRACRHRGRYEQHRARPHRGHGLHLPAGAACEADTERVINDLISSDLACHDIAYGGEETNFTCYIEIEN